MDILDEVAQLLGGPTATYTRWWAGERPALLAAVQELRRPADRSPMTLIVAVPEAALVEDHPNEFCRLFEVCIGYVNASNRVNLPDDIIMGTFTGVYLPRLVAAATAQAPAIAHQWGDERLTSFLFGLVVSTYLVRTGQAPLDDELADLVSTTPNTLLHLPDCSLTTYSVDGGLLVGAEKATTKELLRYAGYTRSLRPAGRPGRPHGVPKPKGKPRPRISDEAIADTGSMRVAEWAAKHIPDCDMGDKRQAKAAYAKYDRAAYHRRNRTPLK